MALKTKNTFTEEQKQKQKQQQPGDESRPSTRALPDILAAINQQQAEMVNNLASLRADLRAREKTLNELEEFLIDECGLTADEASDRATWAPAIEAKLAQVDKTIQKLERQLDLCATEGSRLLKEVNNAISSD